MFIIQIIYKLYIFLISIHFVCLLKFNVSFRHCYGHIGDINIYAQKVGDILP